MDLVDDSAIFLFITNYCANTRKQIKNVIWTPIVYIFGFSWVPIILLGFIKRKQKVWVHTPHNRVMDKEKMLKMEELT